MRTKRMKRTERTERMTRTGVKRRRPAEQASSCEFALKLSVTHDNVAVERDRAFA